MKKKIEWYKEKNGKIKVKELAWFFLTITYMITSINEKPLMSASTI